MLKLSVHGATYASVEEMQTRIDELQTISDRPGVGPSDGRVTEQNALREAITAATPEEIPEWQVVKNEWGVPCSHPSCAILHKRLAKEPYADGAVHTEWATRPGGIDVRVQTRYWHEVTRFDWIVLHNGERVGDPSDTKREALAAMMRLIEKEN